MGYIVECADHCSSLLFTIAGRHYNSLFTLQAVFIYAALVLLSLLYGLIAKTLVPLKTFKQDSRDYSAAIDMHTNSVVAINVTVDPGSGDEM